jgi:hypothetical protein
MYLVDVHNWLLTGNDLGSLHSWERSQDLGDITPPLLAKSLVPIDGNSHSVRKTGLLLPTKLSQLGSVNSISVIVERTITSVLDLLG